MAFLVIAFIALISPLSTGAAEPDGPAQATDPSPSPSRLPKEPRRKIWRSSDCKTKCEPLPIRRVGWNNWDGHSSKKPVLF